MKYSEHSAAEYTSVVDANTQFIDVREPDEYAGGTIDGAVNVPLGQLPDHVERLEPTRRTVLLCRSGNRSGRAAEYLADLGFTDVINLTGGVIAFADRARDPLKGTRP